MKESDILIAESRKVAGRIDVVHLATRVYRNNLTVL